MKKALIGTALAVAAVALAPQAGASPSSSGISFARENHLATCGTMDILYTDSAKNNLGVTLGIMNAMSEQSHRAYENELADIVYYTVETFCPRNLVRLDRAVEYAEAVMA